MYARSRNHCSHEEAINITYYECLSQSLITQHAKRMYYIILSSVACPALQHFSTFSHKRHDFRGGKKELLYQKCVFWFSLQLLSETFLNRKLIQRDIYQKTYIGVYVNYRLFFSDFNETRIFCTNFRKILRHQMSFKICPEGAELRTDGQDAFNIRFS